MRSRAVKRRSFGQLFLMEDSPTREPVAIPNGSFASESLDHDFQSPGHMTKPIALKEVGWADSLAF